MSQVPYTSATSAGIVQDKEEVKLDEEESRISGSFVDFFLQCCSGRNRTQDAQRQAASETGRPPPPPPVNNPDRTFTQTPQTTVLTLPVDSSHSSAMTDFQEALRHMEGQRDTESDNESPYPPESSNKQAIPVHSKSSSDESPPSYAIGPPASAPFQSLGTFNCEEGYERSPLLDDWEWPPWSLNRKQPCIEVFVEDDDTGERKWVAGEPQNRVINETGQDTFLCVEYEWHGEFYTQDFEPHQVRRQGDNRTVRDLCR